MPFFLKGEFIKFNSSLQRLAVSTDDRVFMKKALHGNTPNLQSSAVRAPAALRAEASHSYPPGNQGKPENTLGIASGCETLARHSLRSEERVGLSSEV